MSEQETGTLFERVGGMPFFTALVERFYQGVATDAVLRPMYPEDLEPGKAHLALFLAQYWGGPPQYSMERGHPRLRARHAPFPIDRDGAAAWVRHMRAAVRASDASAVDRARLMAYFKGTAEFLINHHAEWGAR
jgi:hemoglobin